MFFLWSDQIPVSVQSFFPFLIVWNSHRVKKYIINLRLKYRCFLNHPKLVPPDGAELPSHVLTVLLLLSLPLQYLFYIYKEPLPLLMCASLIFSCETIYVYLYEYKLVCTRTENDYISVVLYIPLLHTRASYVHSGNLTICCIVVFHTHTHTRDIYARTHKYRRSLTAFAVRTFTHTHYNIILNKYVYMFVCVCVRARVKYNTYLCIS